MSEPLSAEVEAKLRAIEDTYVAKARRSALATHSPALRDALRAAYTEGRREQSQWISVEERLPAHNGEYLICEQFDNEATVADYFVDSRGWMTVRSYGIDSETRQLHTVTHWQSLPDPPVAEAIRRGGTK